MTNQVESGSYDANGSPTAFNGNSYTWDGANRISSITTSAGTTSAFTYNGLGRPVRVVESSNGTVVADHSYLWCRAVLCLAHDNTMSGSPASTQYFSQGAIISGTSYYYVQDGLGSVREMVAADGSVAAQYDYDPYGNQTTDSGALASDVGYAGYFTPTGTGLDFALYRAYDPTDGRWLNRDPAEELGGINLYAYVQGNPISDTDPLGLFLWPWQQPVSVVGGNAAQQAAVEAALARVLATPRGQQLEDQIRGPWYWPGDPKTLHINCDENDSAEVGGSNLWIDPSYHPLLQMNTGWVPASLARVIGHELGHTLGTGDDGPGQMNNVNLNENPIGTQLGEPYYRISY